jgi:multiple sugar transport system permease protein
MNHRKRLSYAKYGYIFSIPFIVVFLLFSLYPTLFTALLGFTDAAGLGKEYNFLWTVGESPFKQFIDIFNNQTFRKSIGNTFLLWVMNFIPQILLALLLTAWFTSRRTKIAGQGFFKVIFYMPNIITAATVAILFSSFFGYPMGPVNDLVVRFGFADSPVYFLTNKLTAQIIVAFIQFWMWYGYTMLILISGVLGISPDIFDAADIDGASSFQQFFGITLPNIRTIMLYTLITSFIGGLNMFDIPKLFVPNGGPDNATLTASVFIYNQAFSGKLMYARASAASMLMFIVIVIGSLIVFRIMQDKDEVAQRKMMKASKKAQRGGMI